MTDRDSEAGGNPGFKLITLRGKRGAGKFAKVSPEDFEYINQFKWNVGTDGYARRSILKSEQVEGQKSISMHRQVMNPPRLANLDHINRDRLDNRRENLRIATQRQNIANQGPKGGSSRYKGVSTNGQSFLARLWVSGKELYLGSYQDEELAARAYDKAARYFFSEFAGTNFEGDEKDTPANLRKEAYRAYEDRKVSRHIGVEKYPAGWRARLQVKGKQYLVHHLSTEDEAARAYDDLRAKHGLPRVNFPDESFAPLDRGASYLGSFQPGGLGSSGSNPGM